MTNNNKIKQLAVVYQKKAVKIVCSSISPNIMEPEEGELSSSSDEVYIPLQRPETKSPKIKITPAQQQLGTENFDEIDSPHTSTEDESEDDNCLTSREDKAKKKKRTKRTVMVRIQPTDEDEIKRARFKKYNIWTATAEEDALTQNMRSCDVTRNQNNDRNVETYDYRVVNGRKRRRDGESDDEMYPVTKRGRDSSQESNSERRKYVKSRLGNRLVLDLDDTTNKEPADLGREMANKLYEEKDELLIRVVEVLGIELSTSIFKETQKIESNGGMMINNGARRRTPGGVFLFLLKNHENVTFEQRKNIFDAEKQHENRLRKDLEATLRDRKVAQLKKRLIKNENLPILSTRKELLLAESQDGNLSNPPPSPVIGQENSPEYKNPTIINHAVPDVTCPSTSSSSAFKDINTSDDLDFLDLNYPDMDLF